MSDETHGSKAIRGAPARARLHPPLCMACGAFSAARRAHRGAYAYFPILTGDAIDRILAPGRVDFEGVANLAVRMAIIVGITALAQWLLSLCNNRIAYETVRSLRNAAFAHIQRLPLSYLDAHSHGELVSRVIADADQFSEGLLMGFTQLFTGVITILGTLGFMVFAQLAHCARGGCRHARVPVRGGVHRKAHLCHVQAAIRNARRANRAR